jgi:hypothetical protein
MRRYATLLCCLLAACAGNDDAADADATTDSTAIAASSADPKPVDLNGTWDMQSMPENSDSVIARYRIWITDDTSGWKMNFDHQPDTLAVHVVSMAGDSVVTLIGPYRSALRKDVMVTTNTVYRIINGELVGHSVAHYNITTPDSVLIVRARGTRAQ